MFKIFNQCKVHSLCRLRAVCKAYLKPSVQNKYFTNDHCSTGPWNILFFGTDEFSVESLRVLTEELKRGELIQQLDVVTSLKEKKNAVHQFAEKNNLKLYDWPPKHDHKCHIGIVVSFGHLIPKKLISTFPLGMLNVHASLLPRWRGAAPIIHAIMNRDEETGVTIMQIQPHRFDVGAIVKQSRYQLSADCKLPAVTHALAQLGGALLRECLQELPGCLQRVQSQPNTGVTLAPRVDASTAAARWADHSALQVYALSRALDGLFPLSARWQGRPVKLWGARLPRGRHRDQEADRNTEEQQQQQVDPGLRPGAVRFHRPSGALQVRCADGHWVEFTRVGVPGKRPMTAGEFSNGYLSKQPEDARYLE